MDKNKVQIKITNRRILKERLQKDIDSRLDELFGRKLGLSPTGKLKRRGGVEWWRQGRGDLAALSPEDQPYTKTQGDEYRFGYRQGLAGGGMRQRSKRDAMDKGVVDRATGQRVFGRDAWNISKRKQQDQGLKRGKATWADHFRMAHNPEKFKQDYMKRTGEAPPGFDQEDKMRSDFSTPFGQKSPGARYMGATTDTRKATLDKQKVLAKRLAGDPEAVAAFRKRATAVAQSGMSRPKRRAGFGAGVIPGGKVAWTPDFITNPKRTPEDEKEKYPYTTEPIGKRPRLKVNKPKTERPDFFVNLLNTLRDAHGRTKPGEASAEELGRRWKPWDEKRPKGHGRPGEKGYSRHGHQFSRRPQRKETGWDWMDPRPRKDASTIYTGSPLSEMLRRRLRHA